MCDILQALVLHPDWVYDHIIICSYNYIIIATYYYVIMYIYDHIIILLLLLLLLLLLQLQTLNRHGTTVHEDVRK